MSFFFEPSHALIHSGLWKSYHKKNKINLIEKNTPFGISEIEVENYMGRSFILVKKINFNTKALKKYFNENNVIKANISRRNFPLSPEEIKNKLKLKDGGIDYLFFLFDDKATKICFHCKK